MIDKVFTDLENVVASAKVDAEKFYNKGNASAGSRLRKKLMAIKQFSHELRKSISEAKNKQA